MKKLKKINALIFGLILIFCIFLYYYITLLKIKNSHAFASGEVSSLYKTRSFGGVGVRYNYVVDQHIYFGGGAIICDKNIYEPLKCLLLGKKFPVAFQKTKPENSQILILSSDYRMVNITIPDSLKLSVNYLDSVTSSLIIFGSKNDPCSLK